MRSGPSINRLKAHTTHDKKSIASRERKKLQPLLLQHDFLLVYSNTCHLHRSWLRRGISHLHVNLGAP